MATKQTKSKAFDMAYALTLWSLVKVSGIFAPFFNGY